MRHSRINGEFEIWMKLHFRWIQVPAKLDAKQAYFAMMRKQEPKKADEAGKLKEVLATPQAEVLATP